MTFATIRPGFSFCFFSTGEAATHDFGKKLAFSVFPGLLILLSGGLGAGKTVLVRGLVEGLSGKNVRSPSFTLVNEYEAGIPVTHADLYRLPPQNYEDLGLEEALEEGRLVLVEWSDNWKQPPECDIWRIALEIPQSEEDSQTRHIALSAFGERATSALEEARGRINHERRSIVDDQPGV